MAPLHFDRGSVAGWGGNTSEADGLLAAIAPATYTLSVSADEEDVTTLAGGSLAGRSYLPAIRSWTAAIDGMLSGYEGGTECQITTGGSDYLLHVQSFTLQFNAPPSDVTEVANAGWRVYRPGLISASGTISMLVSDTTPISALRTFGDAPASFAITYKSGHTIAFDAFYQAQALSVPTQGMQTLSVTYRVTGGLTFAGATNPLLPAGAFAGRPDDSDIELTLASNTGYTHVGDAFWSSIGLTFAAGQRTAVSIQAQGTGPLTTTLA